MNITSQSPSSFWDANTRLLHLGLASLVTFELLASLIMQEPESGRPITGFGGAMLELHEWIGMAALAIVLLHWLWSLWGAAQGGVNHLFPWRREDRVRMGQELRDLASLHLPPGGPEGRLSGFVHGLGLLAVTAMVLTGAVLFFGMPEESSRLTPLTETSEEIHEIFATIVWIYWGGHVALAVLHEVLARDGSLSRMFRLG